MNFNIALNDISALLFPSRCRVCGRWGAGPVCGKCVPVIQRFRIRSSCQKCGNVAVRNISDCQECRGRRLYITATVAGYRFEGGIREMIHAGKYCNDREILKWLTTALSEKIMQAGLNNKVVICPVPLSKNKLRRRGYNQSEIIAGRLSCLTGIPMIQCLAKKRNTIDQNTLIRKERLKNLAGAFSCITAPPASIILVDDVMTTGSTVNECARILKKAGNSQVIAAVLSRAT